MPPLQTVVLGCLLHIKHTDLLQAALISVFLNFFLLWVASTLRKGTLFTVFVVQLQAISRNNVVVCL